MQTPTGPGTAQTIKVDAAVSAGFLLDEDELLVLLPTAELAPGLKATLSVLGEEGKVEVMNISVLPKETAEVPAGKFEVFPVQAKFSETIMVYVTVAAPHRIVRAVYQEAGVDLRLVK
jgi:hypothetical protein